MTPKLSKVSRYRQLFQNGLNRKISVSFSMAKKDDAGIRKVWHHDLVGTIILLRKHSLRLQLDDDSTINVGFRNIKQCYYLDHSFKLKSKLYYGKGKY